MKYKANCDFHDSRVGRMRKGDIIDEKPGCKDLAVAGYLTEYKTKVVQQRPEKVTKKKTKKKAKK
jgi:hypothetical protein